MKRKLKNPFMLVLITFACMALFVNFSWASFADMDQWIDVDFHA